MDQHIFNFNSAISKLNIPPKLNNPFGSIIPEIAKIAVSEFQQFIEADLKNWDYDFQNQKGKMFGVLVIQKDDSTYGFLGAISGRIPVNASAYKFTPSTFDTSTDNFFIDKGMTELTELGKLIESTTNQIEVKTLTDKRKQKSIAIQQQLFENYQFLNIYRKEKNVLQIFENSIQGKPPSAAGECAAPKLLNYAFRQNLKPIAIAEFWWGYPPNHKNKEHKAFYPACKNKCRPILEYMLDDRELFNKASTVI